MGQKISLVLILVSLLFAGQEIDDSLYVSGAVKIDSSLYIGKTPVSGSAPDSIMVKLGGNQVGLWPYAGIEATPRAHNHGTGTTNYLTKYTSDTGSVGNSTVVDSGTGRVMVGNAMMLETDGSGSAIYDNAYYSGGVYKRIAATVAHRLQMNGENLIWATGPGYYADSSITWETEMVLTKYGVTFDGTLSATGITDNGLTALQIVETDGSKKLISASKNTGYNLSLGTTAGTVMEGIDTSVFARDTDLSNYYLKTVVNDSLANKLWLHGKADSAVIADSAKAVRTHNQAWSTITNTPTTISGYGITDAYTKTEINDSLALKLNISDTSAFARDGQWGSGTTNYLAKFTDGAAGTIGNSIISDDGSDVTILGRLGVGMSPVTRLTTGKDTDTISEMTLQGQYQSSGFTNRNSFNFRHGGYDRTRLSTVQTEVGSHAFTFKVQTINATVDGYNDVLSINGLNKLSTFDGNIAIGANLIGFDGTASEGLAINTNGYAHFTHRVGIGTGASSPGASLDVIGASGIHPIRASTQSQYGGIILRNPSDQAIGGISVTDAGITQGQLDLYDTGVAKVTIRSNGTSSFNGGNVATGINFIGYDGTASEGLTFDTDGHAYLTHNLIFSSARDHVIGVNSSDNSDNRMLSLVSASARGSTRGAFIDLYGNEHTSSAGQVGITAGDSGYIALTGKVGIGTTPDSTLGISGSMHLTGASQFDGTVTIQCGTGSTDIKVGGVASQPSIRWTDYDTTTISEIYTYGTGFPINVIHYEDNQAIKFYVGGEAGGDLSLTVDTSGAQVTGGLEVTGDVYTTVLTDYSSSSTVGGFSSFDGKIITYKVIGKLCLVQFYIAGTSNSAAFTFTLPHSSKSGSSTMPPLIRIKDNDVSDIGVIVLNGGSNSVDIQKGVSMGSFTASGIKEARGQFFYEIE